MDYYSAVKKNSFESVLMRWMKLEPIIQSASFNSFFFFWCGPLLKSLLNLLQFCFCFLAWVFGLEACGTLASGSEAALEGEILTTGLPGRSLFSILSVVYRAGIYRSCSNSILIFLRNLPAIFHSGCTFYTPTNSAQSFHFLHMPPNSCCSLFCFLIVVILIGVR